MGTSSTTYAKTPMAIKMTYWNAMKIHIELAKLVSKIFIVKQSIPALVMTEATAVICKIDNHVPISCAPTGMVRLNLILNHSTLQHCNYMLTSSCTLICYRQTSFQLSCSNMQAEVPGNIGILRVATVILHILRTYNWTCRDK